MITYTLSIEDRVGRGITCTERAILINGKLLTSEKGKEVGVYNPNAKPKEGFNPYDPSTFDTPFSIIHPFRDIAKLVAEHYSRSGGSGVPKIKYDCSVKDAQQLLFENILKQEVYNHLYGYEEAGARQLLETLPEDRVVERMGLQGRLENLKEKKQQILSLP